MKIKILSIFVVCALTICSCSSTKKTTTSVPPPLPEDNTKTEITVRSEKVTPVDPSDRAMYRFYVIIGSFKNVDNARKENITLANKGFTPVILKSESGLYRISVGGYDDESAARSKIAGIRAAYKEHSDVWLLIRK